MDEAREPRSRADSGAPAGAERAGFDPVRAMREHPIIVGVMLTSMVAGAGIAFSVLPEDLSALRRIVGGAIGGALAGICITAPRIVG